MGVRQYRADRFGMVSSTSCWAFVFVYGANAADTASPLYRPHVCAWARVCACVLGMVSASGVRVPTAIIYIQTGWCAHTSHVCKVRVTSAMPCTETRFLCCCFGLCCQWPRGHRRLCGELKLSRCGRDCLFVRPPTPLCCTSLTVG